MPEIFAQVVVDSRERWADSLYTYQVPTELEALLQPGMLVEVPFGTRLLAGYVLELSAAVPELDRDKIRPISRLIEPTPIWGQELLDLARWLGRFYQSTWQDSLQAVIPGPVLLRLRKLPKPRKSPQRKPKESSARSASHPRPELTASQSRAVETLWDALSRGQTALLHGVTGSGKTEVYLQLAERMLASGRSVIVLVPEVALTPQAIERYRGRLGETVALMHSALGQGDRRASWARLRDGTCRLALGTRSAVFAPLTDVGLFIVDEEHDHSYKQESSPRYHARQVASWRCAFAAGQGRTAGLLLGSATPCLETYYMATQGRYALVTLSERATGAPLPPVTTVDLRKLRFLKGSVLSPLLLARLQAVTEAGNQAVLLYNRRGFSPYIQCLDCGEVVFCHCCSISLTLHHKPVRLSCHYCGFEQPPPDCCPKCGGARLLEKGAGTEKVELELSQRLPHLRVLRLDRDTTGKVGSHETILEAFGKGEADVLLGTQMVAKGLDFPKVALVGVLSADQGLHFPDFRAPERTFQLLTQVAGRAGRSEVAGEVIIQGNDLDHPCIQFALNHDYRGFVEHELAIRREALYPPFCRLVRLVISAARLEMVEKFCAQLEVALRKLKDLQILGPVACPIEQIRGMQRWHFLLKGGQVKDILEKTRKALGEVPFPAGLRVAIDPDPQSLL